MSEEQNLSKEEIQKRRQEITSFYSENIEHLKVQKEYEELLRDIEKARAERIQAQIFLAQAYNSSNEENDDNDLNPEEDFEKAMNKESKRSLKRS